MIDVPVRAVRAEDWVLCEEIARVHGRSFFFASRLLGPERRRSILAAYAYCRIADDIVDKGNGELALIDEQLAAWEHEISEPEHPVAVAFAHARVRYDIPERPIRELFDGMRADLVVNRYGCWPELRGYCHQVAGTVGLIVAPILGCSDPKALPRAADLGIAMQLTNILRDVGEDAALGRVYLPQDELERFDLDTERLQAGQPGLRFPEFMQFQIGRARALYADALTGVPALSSGGRMTTLAAAHLYSGILDQIESNRYDVFGRRAVVSRNQKAKSTASAALHFVHVSTASGWIPFRTGAPGSQVVRGAERDVEGWIP